MIRTEHHPFHVLPCICISQLSLYYCHLVSLHCLRTVAILAFCCTPAAPRVPRQWVAAVHGMSGVASEEEPPASRLRRCKCSMNLLFQLISVAFGEPRVFSSGRHMSAMCTMLCCCCCMIVLCDVEWGVGQVAAAAAAATVAAPCMCCMESVECSACILCCVAVVLSSTCGRHWPHHGRHIVLIIYCNKIKYIEFCLEFSLVAIKDLANTLLLVIKGSLYIMCWALLLIVFN